MASQAFLSLMAKISLVKIGQHKETDFMKNRYFISVDWGTTNFRLRLVNKSGPEIIEEIICSSGGVKKIFESWKVRGGEKDTFFLQFLQSQIGRINNPVSQDLLVVISGMASSNIGLKELPYKGLPLPLDGKDISTGIIESNVHCKHDILLISGVRSDQDVARGEETELIGLLTNYKAASGKRLFLFPGTHSKHFIVEGNYILSFKTFMTGEFFDLLSKESLLKAAVTIHNDIKSKEAIESFKRGISDSIEGNLLNVSFKVRTNNIFNTMNKKDNFNYLSGLLIGTELKDLVNTSYSEICLASNSVLDQYYKIALNEIFGADERITILERKLLDENIVKGQNKIMNYNIQKNER